MIRYRVEAVLLVGKWRGYRGYISQEVVEKDGVTRNVFLVRNDVPPSDFTPEDLPMVENFYRDSAWELYFIPNIGPFSDAPDRFGN